MRNLPEDMIASLGQDTKLEWLEWRMQCFLEDPNERKRLEETGDKFEIYGSSK